MKKFLSMLSVVAFVVSCSSPKYSYNFDYYDYNSGKKEALAQSNEARTEIQSEVNAAAFGDQTRVASSSNDVAYLAKPERAKGTSTAVKSRWESLSKSERKEIRKEAIKDIKEYIRAKKSGDHERADDAIKRMDEDLKWAAIFGAIGIVGLLIGGDVFYVLGAIALIIGVVFFVFWLMRQ